MGFKNVLYGFLQQLGVVPTPEFPSSGLTSYWSMDEVNGATLYDSKCTNDGTASGTYSYVSGKEGNALDTNGAAGTYVNVGNDSSLKMGTGNFTVSCWIYPRREGQYEGITTNVYLDRNGYLTSIIPSGHTGPSSQYYFFMAESTSKLKGIGSIATIPKDEWTMVTAVRSGLTMSLYVNGEFDSSTTTSSLFNVSYTLPMYISRFRASSTGAGLDGLIDELGIWSRDLSSNEISDLYNNGVGLFYRKTVPTSGLTSYYSMDIVDGTTVFDSVGDGHLYKENGSFSAGFHNNGWVQNKSSTGGLVGTASTFDFGANEPFTFNFWVKSGGLGNSGLLINKQFGTSGSAYPGYYLAINTSNQMYINIIHDNAAGELIGKTCTSATLSDTNWTMITYSYDGSGDASGVTIHKNGVSQTMSTSSNGLGNLSPSSSEPFRIGSYYTGTAASGNYLGEFDEFGCWDRVLTADEITDMYNCGRGVFYEAITPEYPTSGLTAYWSMDNVAGSTVFDSLNGYSGTSSNVTFAAGKNENGATFNGSSSKINFGDVLNWERTQPYTYSCWFKRGTTSGVGGIFANIEVSTGVNRGNFDIFFNGTRMAVEIIHRGGSPPPVSMIQVYTDYVFTDTSNWHHLAVCYDGSSKASGVTYYLDGVYSGFTSVLQDNLTGTTINNRPLNIGVRENTHWYNGQFDECALYNRVLSSDEIRDIYNISRGVFYDEVFPTGATSYYNMDGDTNDSIGEYNGTGTSITYGTGINLSGATFNSTNSNINIGNVYNFERTDPFSISCWVKRTAVGGAAPFIFSKSEASGNFAGYSGYIYSANKIIYTMQNNGSNLIQIESNTVLNSTAVWYHLVFTYNGSSNASGMTIYIDGSLDASSVNADTLSATTQTSENFQIGNRNSALGANAIIDEFAIFERELTAKEASNIYNSGNGKFYN